jgi:hypothetical protein
VAQDLSGQFHWMHVFVGQFWTASDGIFAVYLVESFNIIPTG